MFARLFLTALFLLIATPAFAQRMAQRVTFPQYSFPAFSPWHGYDFASGGIYAPYPSFGYSHYLAPFPPPPRYPVYILEATHDYRNWPFLPRILKEAANGRLIGVGVPTWAVPEGEPLGDVARRNRERARALRPEQRAILHIHN